MHGHMVWPAEAIWEAVAPLLPGFTVEVVPQIDSTNSELMRRARAGQLDPVLLVAESQTAGRGRLGRDWQSEVTVPQRDTAASLTFSLGLPLQPRDWSGLSLAIGLAVVQSLHPDLRLKWPNDVWLGQRKLAGILIETTSVGQQRYVVIGIGINILPRSDAGLRTASAALVEVLPQADAPSILQALMLPLVQTLQQFLRTGFEPMRPAYHARDLLCGQAVVCTGGTTGVAQGVDAEGALLVHTADGLKKISSAEVSVRPAPSAGTAMEQGS